MYTRKKQNFVNFDLRNLNLNHYVVPGFENQFSHFNLYAVSNHFGNLEGGHYTAYASSDVLKRWYKFDDQVRTARSLASPDTNPLYNAGRVRDGPG